MLRVSRLTGDGRYYSATPGDGARRRSSGGRAASDPYADGSGYWLGPGGPPAHGPLPVEADGLAKLLSGRHPLSGRPRPGRPTTVSGYDLTVSAPKSVSVLLALSDPPTAARVRRDHEAAVAAAVDYVRARAVSARRRLEGERVALRAELGPAAAFTHTASRALDPHLHSHVIVANRAQGVDGRWTAIDGGMLRAHALAAGAVYAAHLRHELVGHLGVAWRRVGPVASGRFEIEGLDPLLLGCFSGRRAEILADLADAGRSSARASRVAWAASRAPKQRVTPGELRRRWRERAADVGVGPDQIRLALGGPTRPIERLDEYRFAASLATVGPGATRRDVVRAWCDALVGGSPASAVDRSVDRLLPADGDRRPEPPHALAELVPSPRVLRSLGPRPAAPTQLAVWLAAARRPDRLIPRSRPAEPPGRPPPGPGARTIGRESGRPGRDDDGHALGSGVGGATRDRLDGGRAR